jgi:hypothetical protein
MNTLFERLHELPLAFLSFSSNRRSKVIEDLLSDFNKLTKKKGGRDDEEENEERKGVSRSQLLHREYKISTKICLFYIKQNK